MRTGIPALGHWRQGEHPAAYSDSAIEATVFRIREPIHVVRKTQDSALGVALGGTFGSNNADGIVNLRSTGQHEVGSECWSETSRRILGDVGKFAPRLELGCELFAIH